MGAPKDNILSRAERKSKKRALEKAIPDFPGDEKPPVDEAMDGNEDGEKKGKKRKRDRGEDVEGDEEGDKQARKAAKKKRKSENEGGLKIAGEKSTVITKAETGEGFMEGVEVNGEAVEGEEALRKSKKERKAERKAKDSAQKEATKNAAHAPATTKTDASGEKTAKANGTAATAENGEEKSRSKNNRNREKRRQAIGGETGKENRFICFIGNLPFTATTSSIEQHFIKLKPKTVRHITQKDAPAKSKGIAFLEFDDYDRMKTCLKLYHHSMFDDGLSAARQINVELTSGGGGNSKERKTKISEKNKRLNEQRQRRAEEEAKVKNKKKAEEGGVESTVHPSRRAHVPDA
ncbi:hypothetical protein BJ878DRAFT_576456 [Calycina marina]|uniref:RRM domain-containing protein n=1 Tax=Calycina marina TaxID=1763456 RepID=A0A9P8CE02_9HELO|nr:hypothetical protein BJ878DRAFT_576456 [Calycina marina]